MAEKLMKHILILCRKLTKIAEILYTGVGTNILTHTDILRRYVELQVNSKEIDTVSFRLDLDPLAVSVVDIMKSFCPDFISNNQFDVGLI